MVFEILFKVSLNALWVVINSIFYTLSILHLGVQDLIEKLMRSGYVINGFVLKSIFGSLLLNACYSISLQGRNKVLKSGGSHSVFSS